MELLHKFWGSGVSLNCLQMAIRGIAAFIIALALIRASGRRSFGMGTPLDNIIVILLGAVLSRGVVGASPFVPIVITCFAIVTLHRISSWIKVKSPAFSILIDGKKILLYSDGSFIKSNMEKALLCREDIYQGVRESALLEDLDKVDRIYMERNGEISVIKKQP